MSGEEDKNKNPEGGDGGQGDGGQGDGGQQGHQAKNPEGDVVQLSKQEFEEYQKLKDKDMNFKRYRDKTQGDLEQKNQTIEEMNKQFDQFKQEQTEWRQKMIDQQYSEHYESLMKSLVGDDDKLREKVEFNYKRLGEGDSKETISKNLRDAFTLATGQAPTNPINRVAQPGGSPAFPGGEGFQPSRESYADSAEGRAALDHMFPKGQYPRLDWDKVK